MGNIKEKPKIGDILYSLNVGNAVSKVRKPHLTEVIVKAVGRKYFTCGVINDTWKDTQYHLSNWVEKTDCNATSKLYKSKQEWEDEMKINTISSMLSEYFKYNENSKGLSLEKLREIELIVNRKE